MLNVKALHKLQPTTHSELRAPLINGSTLLTAIYLEWCLLPCGHGCFCSLMRRTVKGFVCFSTFIRAGLLHRSQVLTKFDF